MVVPVSEFSFLSLSSPYDQTNKIALGKVNLRF